MDQTPCIDRTNATATCSNTTPQGATLSVLGSFEQSEKWCDNYAVNTLAQLLDS